MKIKKAKMKKKNTKPRKRRPAEVRSRVRERRDGHMSNRKKYSWRIADFWGRRIEM